MLTPARRRGTEILDDPAVDPEIRRRSIGDVTRSNRWLGGRRAADLEIRQALGAITGDAFLLDVGTGLADIPARAHSRAAAAGRHLATIGVDEAATLLQVARGRVTYAICADALALPFRDGTIDIVMCSQILHHFADTDAGRLIGEMDRVAKRVAIVSDLRRSWFAAIGFWLVSFPLGFHRVTRHDGVVSVLRGFTAGDLCRLITAATGTRPIVQRRLGYRLTARWAPRTAR